MNKRHPDGKRRLPNEAKTPFCSCNSFGEHREELVKHLNVAMQLEHATIPPYLCALYSIKDGTNQEAAFRIRSVVVEEMLHMVLVGNLLISIGETPKLVIDGFIPRYPSPLPMSEATFDVQLNRFSPEAIENFKQIESPGDIDAEPDSRQAICTFVNNEPRYATIGHFYLAIKDAIDKIVHDYGETKLFTGRKEDQVSESEYYSGGGEIIQVTNYASARRAIKVIVDEGEGFNESLFSSDHDEFGEQQDLAHYYKFNEIAYGRRYAVDDSPDRPPTGQRIPVDFSESAVRQASFQEEDFPDAVQGRLKEFHETYTSLLTHIELGFSGAAAKSQRPFESAVQAMFAVKQQMIELMNIPIAPDSQYTCGPTFPLTN